MLIGAHPIACGGGTPEPSTAERASDEKSSAKADGDESESASESETEAAAPARKAACDDGTCTPCGDAQCPLGWYCDESAKGGPSCGWLPECAKKPTCACVKKVYSGSCEERAGGVFVKHE
jgi:hypothetical protein